MGMDRWKRSSLGFELGRGGQRASAHVARLLALNGVGRSKAKADWSLSDSFVKAPADHYQRSKSTSKIVKKENARKRPMSYSGVLAR